MNSPQETLQAQRLVGGHNEGHMKMPCEAS